jgi:hypothetical protein
MKASVLIGTGAASRSSVTTEEVFTLFTGCRRDRVAVVILVTFVRLVLAPTAATAQAL